jgi:hypothetical protein
VSDVPIRKHVQEEEQAQAAQRIQEQRQLSQL